MNGYIVDVVTIGMGLYAVTLLAQAAIYVYGRIVYRRKVKAILRKYSDE